jgi:hypothetical protein
MGRETYEKGREEWKEKRKKEKSPALVSQACNPSY